MSLVSRPLRGSGRPDLPEDLAVESDGGQATDLVEGIAAHARNVLRDQHVDLAVAVEVAEAHVAPGAELRGGELSPELGLRILGAQLRQFGLRAGLRVVIRPVAAVGAVTRKS